MGHIYKGTMPEEFALKSELARFLRMEPEDIDRAVAEDKLPCLKLLGSRKFSQRFPLRGVHAWLLERTENVPERMWDYGRFREDFEGAVKARKKA